MSIPKELHDLWMLTDRSKSFYQWAADREYEQDAVGETAKWIDTFTRPCARCGRTEDLHNITEIKKMDNRVINNMLHSLNSCPGYTRKLRMLNYG